MTRWIYRSLLAVALLAAGSTPAFGFSDVSPSHWAYQALQQLVNRYGCIAGYPDGSFQGEQPLTRYEFAAGLNACLETLVLLQQSADAVSPEEVRELQGSLEELQQQLGDLEEDVR